AESSDDDELVNVGDDVDEEITRAFATSEPMSAGNDSAVDTSSTKSETSDRSSRGKRSSSACSSSNIEAKILHSLVSKQQKQFSNLLFDSFQVIMSNPNSTPAEIECMQTAFRKCGMFTG